MKSLARLLLAVAVLAAIVLAVVAGYEVGSKRKAAPETRVDSAPVVQAVREVAKLATVEVAVSDVVRYEEVRTIIVFDFPKNATLRVRGTVLGGFDLSKGFAVTSENASRRIRVDLPPPQILSVDARIEWFDEHSGWLNPITPQDRTRWTAWSRGALGKVARDAALFDRAATHARGLLTDVAEALGWTAEVKIRGVELPAGPAGHEMP